MSDGRTILVTGGSGFIGSAVVRLLLAETGWRVVNLDKLTYAANPLALEGAQHNPRYRFEQACVADAEAVRAILARHRPDAIMHLAAETHVDRSIDGPAEFMRTNILGTYTLLEAVRDYLTALGAPAGFRFHHVSTDEVFGSLGHEGAFTEDSPYRPNSPYSASKAAADHLARAWRETYRLPVLVSNCSNNYGPWQFPEKLVPLMIARAVRGEALPVYGRGENVRDWLHVEDHARALLAVLERGTPGETYNVGGSAERTNIDLVRALCAILDEALPDSPHRPHERLIGFVADRPGHDLRYAIDSSKLARTLGWQPRETLETGLRKTVEWYLAHRDWWSGIAHYRQDRLGLAVASGR